MGAGMGRKIDISPAVVAARNNRSHTHIEVGVGLSLRVHSGKAVHQPWKDELSSAVDHFRALGDGNCAARADIGNAPVAHNHNRIGEVPRRTAPVAEVHNGSASQNQRSRHNNLWRNGGLCLWPGENPAQSHSTQTRQNATKKSHKKSGLMWIVAQRFRENRQALKPATSVWRWRRASNGSTWTSASSTERPCLARRSSTLPCSMNRSGQPMRTTGSWLP